MNEKLKIIGAVLLRITGHDKTAAAQELKKITSFAKDDGSMFDGYTSLKDITSEKAVNVLYGKCKKLFLDDIWERFKQDVLKGK